jgi:hypothetical protein
VAGAAGAPATGGSSGGSQITEQDLDRCEQDADCIVVAYQHCCGATKRAINEAYLEEYNSHPEWQVFDDEATCATIGMCLDDSEVDTAVCEGAPEGRCSLVFP